MSNEYWSGNVWYCYYSVTRRMVEEFEMGGRGGNFRSFVHCCNQQSVCIIEENENLTSTIWTTMLQCCLRNYFHRTSTRYFQRIIVYWGLQGGEAIIDVFRLNSKYGCVNKWYDIANTVHTMLYQWACDWQDFKYSHLFPYLLK